MGTAMAADEFEKGNYGRAALEMLSGVASLVPGVGTMVSAAIDTGLLLTQDDNETKKPKAKAMDMAKIASADSQTVGATAVGEMATASQRTQEQQIAGEMPKSSTLSASLLQIMQRKMVKIHH